jgi:hypothetical protein
MFAPRWLRVAGEKCVRMCSRYNGGGAEGWRVGGRSIAKHWQLAEGPLLWACAGVQRDGRHLEPWVLVDPCGYIRPLKVLATRASLAT